MTDFDYQLRISKRAKYVRVCVKTNRQVEVVLPLGVSTLEADKLVQQQYHWIIRALGRMQSQSPASTDTQPESIHLPAIEQWIRIQYACQQKRNVMLDGDVLCVRLSKTDKHVPKLLHMWLKAYAKKYLPNMLAKVAKDMGLSYQSVSIRLQKTRWGSCSHKQSIALNAKLLLLPKEVLHYVLVHELAHLVHMNHSPQFWQYVAHFVHDYTKQRQALRESSLALPAWLLL